MLNAEAARAVGGRHERAPFAFAALDALRSR
jgi:hypothetical protein